MEFLVKNAFVTKVSYIFSLFINSAGYVSATATLIFIS